MAVERHRRGREAAEDARLRAEGCKLAAARFDAAAGLLVPKLNTATLMHLRELFDPFHQLSIWELALIEAAPPGTLVPHCQPPQSFYEGKLQ